MNTVEEWKEETWKTLQLPMGVLGLQRAFSCGVLSRTRGEYFVVYGKNKLWLGATPAEAVRGQGRRLEILLWDEGATVKPEIASLFRLRDDVLFWKDRHQIYVFQYDPCRERQEPAQRMGKRLEFPLTAVSRLDDRHLLLQGSVFVPRIGIYWVWDAANVRAPQPVARLEKPRSEIWLPALSPFEDSLPGVWFGEIEKHGKKSSRFLLYRWVWWEKPQPPWAPFAAWELFRSFAEAQRIPFRFLRCDTLACFWPKPPTGKSIQNFDLVCLDFPTRVEQDMPFGTVLKARSMFWGADAKRICLGLAGCVWRSRLENDRSVTHEAFDRTGGRVLASPPLKFGMWPSEELYMFVPLEVGDFIGLQSNRCLHLYRRPSIVPQTLLQSACRTSVSCLEARQEPFLQNPLRDVASQLPEDVRFELERWRRCRALHGA